jgi:eukaryotic-like serine/threonine-protein kinase
MDLLRNLLPRAKPPAVPPIPSALPPGAKVGPWRVVRLLGLGANGAVYLVRRWGRLYALKVAMRPGDKRLLRERRLLRRVKHPGVVGLRGWGWWLGRKKGFPYLVMEYIEGLPLYAWARGTNPTPRQIAELLAQAAEALEAVHQARSVHRDVKGANTLVRPGGRKLVLMDLGAGAYEGATPLTSNVLPPVTEVYLSPEAMDFAQAHATAKGAHYKAGPADDLYALGVMAHRVLTDDYPFPVHVPRDLFWMVVRLRSAPNTRECNPRVPVALAAIVRRLLARRPEERYASAQQVAEALRKAAEGGKEWDELLFEWYTGPEPASRTTNAVAPTGPVAPGQEAALRMARAQHRERQEWMRQRRMVGKRRRGVAQSGEAVPASKSARRWRAAGAVLVLALALAVGAAVLTQQDGAGASDPSAPPAPTLDNAWGLPTQGVGNPGQEVAPALSTPDAGTSAAPSGASTPAPVAPATQPKEDTSVNPPAKEQPSKPKPPAASGSNLVKVLPLCVGIACAHPKELHPVPLSEECPPGAVQTMRELGIKVGDDLEPSVSFPRDFPERCVSNVKEGWITLILTRDFGNLPNGTELSGRLFFGERVYGRFNAARMPNNRTIPVCMDLVEGGYRGAELDSPPSATARISCGMGLKAVDAFR